MANNYNSNPQRIDTTFTGGWRSKQTLNTGTTPGYTSPAQWGIRPFKIVWADPGADASFQITDPNDGTILLEDDTPSGFTGHNPQYGYSNASGTWRDFNVTITGGTLLIFYRV